MEWSYALLWHCFLYPQIIILFLMRFSISFSTERRIGKLLSFYSKHLIKSISFSQNEENILGKPANRCQVGNWNLFESVKMGIAKQACRSIISASCGGFAALRCRGAVNSVQTTSGLNWINSCIPVWQGVLLLSRNISSGTWLHRRPCTHNSVFPPSASCP